MYFQNNTAVSTPLFSVLIANYNNAQYLQTAIGSILVQTYPRWEIVIVDDASTDNSPQIYKQYTQDKRFVFASNDKNRGCGYTKRRCIELAHGEICAFVDPDDAITPDALEKSIAEHIADEKLSLVYSNFYYCDSSLSPIAVSNHQCDIPSGYSAATYKKGAVSHFASFKRQAYLKTEGINPDFLRAVDMDLYYKLEEVGRIKHIDLPLYYYRQSTGSNISLGAHSHYAEIWNTIARLDACRRRSLSLEENLFPFIVGCTEEKIHTAVIERSEQIYRTKPYRLGKTLLKPFKFVKKYFTNGK